MYDRAILVPSRSIITLGGHTTDAMAHIGYTTHISVLFNVALLQHKRANYCNNGQECDDSRKRACELYIWVVRTIEETSDRTESLDLDVLKCLALNNCAVVYYELGQLIKCWRRFQDVELQLLMVNGHLEAFLDLAEAAGIRSNSK